MNDLTVIAFEAIRAAFEGRTEDYTILVENLCPADKKKISKAFTDIERAMWRIS